MFCLIWIAFFALLYLTIPRGYYTTGGYDVYHELNERLMSGGISGNILIGDSKSEWGINAKYLHALNFSLGGAGPIEGYYEARQLIQNKKNKIDTLFISYGMVHLISQNTFYSYSYYYNFFPGTYLDSARQIAIQSNDSNYDIKKSIFSSPLDQLINKPSVSAKIFRFQEFVLGGLNNILKYLYKMKTGQLVKGDNQFVNGRLTTLASDTLKFRRTNETAMPDEDLINVKPSAVDTIYLKKMVKLAEAHHVKVIFIFMPSPESKISALIKDQLADLHSTFPNNLLYDTSAYSDNYFRDNLGHLNADGVNKFQVFLKKNLYDPKSVSQSVPSSAKNNNIR